MNGPVLRMEAVTKSYRVGAGRVAALKAADLTVAAGELVALTGPSGSGKSTLLNLCGLIDTPDSGRRSVAGQQVEGLDEKRLTWLGTLASVATLLLTSDALIAEKPKAEKGGKKAGHGGDYDMY